MDALEGGRDAYARADWPEACRCLEQADRAGGLGGEDLWRLAVASHLTGRCDRFAAFLERACALHREAGVYAEAAWCAFWLGLDLMDHGEAARGSGWLARAERLVAQVPERCVTEGWLLIPQVQMRLGEGAHEEALALAQRATAVADELGNADLHAFALHAQGLAHVRMACVREGLALLDEAMVAVTGETLLPFVTGIVYCSVISACREVYALDRARAWTAALHDWCEGQPGLVPFAGTCLVHRAEVLQQSGAWTDAYEEARRAEALCRQDGDPADVAAAHYVQADLLRLRGRYGEAEAAYEEAARAGRDPQPGLALLRAGQGKHGVARSASSPPTPAARWRWRGATPPTRWPRCAPPGVAGRRRRRRTRRPARANLWDAPARRSATPKPPRWNWTPRGRPTAASAPRPTWRGSTRPTRR
ncbi:MAG: hypothetical protein U5K81_13580 [Trueperaceae bacterium]|nr:hypothetical protein [Trueperaceae bacterium]